MTRKEAIELGLGRYDPVRTCLRGHDSQRYVSNSACVECVSIALRKPHEIGPAEKEYRKQWRSKNPDKVKEYNRKRTENWIKRQNRYKIPVQDLKDMYARQEGKCATCLQELNNKFHVDHCHTKGTVRGMLCRGCNVALGFVKENPIALRGLADYIERTRAED